VRGNCPLELNPIMRVDTCVIEFLFLTTGSHGTTPLMEVGNEHKLSQ